MLLPLERIVKNGKVFFKQKKFVVLKKLKSYSSFPGMDEQRLLGDKRFVEAILLTALRLESNLKVVYFYKKSMKTHGQWYRVSNFSFNTIIEKSLNEKFISQATYKKVEKLRKARNEIAHTSVAQNRYIDAEKCKKIVFPCIKLINRTHNQIIELQNAARVAAK